MRSALSLSLALATACTNATDPEDRDDHAPGRLVVEGEQIGELLGDDLVSDPIAIDDGFRRIGLLWDASDDGAIEVRTSLDGIAWSPWTAPELTSHEDIARAGHVDAIAGLDALGSLDSDPRATHYQLRVPAGVALPTFIAAEPLADIPPRAELDATVAFEVDDELDTIESTLRATPIGAVRIYSRTDWGARPPRCATSRHTPDRATIHHTVTPTNDSMTVPQRLRQIQGFHMFTRGWCDIGYNFLVSRDGRVWRGRGARVVGAHAANANTGNVGISFIGTYTTTKPTAKQLCQTAKLLRRLHMDWPGLRLVRSDVKGHRQYGGTACPGNALYARIDDLLSQARTGCAE